MVKRERNVLEDDEVIMQKREAEEIACYEIEQKMNMGLGFPSRLVVSVSRSERRMV